LFGFVIAGHDTMSTTMCWAVKLLADHGAVQARLRDELQKGHAAARLEKRAPTVHEITQTSIPYLDAAMEELLRCGATVPLGDREATQDTVLLGHHIPKGTIVFFLHNGPGLLMPALPVDDEVRSKQSQAARADGLARTWRDDDVGAFKPERWLVKQLDGTVVFDAQAGPNLPFGLGLRGCFGRRLAYVKFRILLTMLVWHFEMLECPERLSGYKGILAVVNRPKDCYVRLREVKLE